MHLRKMKFNAKIRYSDIPFYFMENGTEFTEQTEFGLTKCSSMNRHISHTYSSHQLFQALAVMLKVATVAVRPSLQQ